MPTMTSTNDNIEQMADSVDHDDDVDRQRSFEGRLNRFLHQANIRTDITTTTTTTTPRPTQQRRIITRSQSSSPSDTATTRLTKHSPSPRRTPLIPPVTHSPTKRKRKQHDSPHLNNPRTQLTFSPPSRLRDTIPPDLILLLIGVNPGLMTGSTGYAYAHPSNLFWKLLHSSGITTIRHPPSDTYKLPELYSVGNTNIVERPTRDASMLTKAEMDAGVPILEAKIAQQRPEAVALVGKSIWESVWRVRHGGKAIKKEEFRYGWQDEGENMGRSPGSWDVGARVFVATTTSGLAATMSLQQKQEVWNELGAWVQKRRTERAGLIPTV